MAVSWRSRNKAPLVVSEGLQFHRSVTPERKVFSVHPIFTNIFSSPSKLLLQRYSVLYIPPLASFRFRLCCPVSSSNRVLATVLGLHSSARSLRFIKTPLQILHCGESKSSRCSCLKQSLVSTFGELHASSPDPSLDSATYRQSTASHCRRPLLIQY